MHYIFADCNLSIFREASPFGYLQPIQIIQFFSEKRISLVKYWCVVLCSFLLLVTNIYNTYAFFFLVVNTYTFTCWDSMNTFEFVLTSLMGGLCFVKINLQSKTSFVLRKGKNHILQTANGLILFLYLLFWHYMNWSIQKKRKPVSVSISRSSILASLLMLLRWPHVSTWWNESSLGEELTCMGLFPKTPSCIIATNSL